VSSHLGRRSVGTYVYPVREFPELSSDNLWSAFSADVGTPEDAILF